ASKQEAAGAETDQELTQLAQQVAEGQDIEQDIEQLAQQVAEGEDVDQDLTQIAQQNAIGNDISQAIEQQTIQQAAGPNVNQEIEQVATQIANNDGAASEEEVGPTEQIIEQIAVQVANGGGNVQQTITQIAQQVATNPAGPVSQSIKQLAQQYNEGNIDEVNQAATQIGTQIAQGNNIQQTLVQVSNQVINNIQNNNINTVNNINNYQNNNVVVHEPKPAERTIITETVTQLQTKKDDVKVPRVHIEFGKNSERNLVLRSLDTKTADYDMPFSKTAGAFRLADRLNEFEVEVLGKGKILTASLSEILSNGKIGPREFLEKQTKSGEIFFDYDDVETKKKYLVDVYIHLSDGSIATFSRGSITVLVVR
nr:hypothetical protein [Nitrosopumilus sp.]